MSIFTLAMANTDVVFESVFETNNEYLPSNFIDTLSNNALKTIFTFHGCKIA